MSLINFLLYCVQKFYKKRKHGPILEHLRKPSGKQILDPELVAGVMNKALIVNADITIWCNKVFHFLAQKEYCILTCVKNNWRTSDFVAHP